MSSNVGFYLRSYIYWQVASHTILLAFFFFFGFLGPHLQLLEVPRLGV